MAGQNWKILLGHLGSVPSVHSDDSPELDTAGHIAYRMDEVRRCLAMPASMGESRSSALPEKANADFKMRFRCFQKIVRGTRGQVRIRAMCMVSDGSCRGGCGVRRRIRGGRPC
ncbi:hypothetical protein GCM10010403_04880 [Glycomyces rutgersensis]|uniref:Transposase n=1 Tax=Glycomyces rutgersensis TaxID=58115 RepID=A0ABP5S3G7_9ACTN